MFDTINKNIIKILGIDTLPLEYRKEAMEEIGVKVYEEIMLRVLEGMNEEEKNAFEKLMETNPEPEVLFTYLKEKVPTLDQIVAESIESLREESVEILREFTT